LQAYSEYSDIDFARHLTEKVGVACIPLSAFYRDGGDTGIVRFCFAKRDETLHEAARRLQSLG
jgi:methionine transaminase